MSAAAARARLAETANAVAAARGGWRAAALARVREERRAPGIADLLKAPDWLRWSARDRQALARLAAVAHLAPRIARTLDGAVLTVLDRAVGTPALARAMELGEGIAFAPALGMEEAVALDALGAALLVVPLAPVLAIEIGPMLLRPDPDPSEHAPRSVAPEAAARAIALALEAWPHIGPKGADQ